MRPIAADGEAWSVCVSVCLLVTFVSHAKMAEPTEMPIEGTLGRPKEPWARHTLTEKGYFVGRPAH